LFVFNIKLIITGIWILS